MSEPGNEATFGARRLVLGFDAGCLACSDLARRIEEQANGKLEVRSLLEPQVEHWRRQALGENAPWAPTLLEIKGAEVKAWTGVRMAGALSKRLGLGATWRVMQVLGEYSASPRVGEPRAARAAGMTRRQFLKGLAGGLAALSILPAGRVSAVGGRAPAVSDVIHLSAGSAAVGRLKRFQAVRDAAGRFGSPDWDEVVEGKYKDNGQERTLYFVPYLSDTAQAATSKTLLIAEDESSLDDAESIVLRIHSTGRNEGRLEYYLADGIPLARVEVEDGKTRVLPPDEQEFAARCRASRSGCPRPGFVRCFIYCLGASVSADCAVSCFFCVTGSFPSCVRCGFCAGPAGVRCARWCR